MIENDITQKVIGAAIEVHKELGPGLLESAYEICLAKELELAGVRFRRQVELPLVYKDVRTDVGYRLDLLVEEKVIIEIKSVEALNDVHLAQVLTYLKLTELHIGLLINFNVAQVRTGIRRIING
jgi:GxxExxY protein